MATEGMPHGIPSGAVPAVALVMTYSVLSLICGLVFLFHVSQMENHFLYMSLFAYASTTMTVIAIVQEIFFIVNWYEITVQTYQAAQDSAKNRYLAFGPQGYGLDRVLYWVQVFLCNACALIVAFWAVNLAINSWGWRFGRLYDRRHLISRTSKVLAFLLPAITVVLRATVHVDTSTAVMVFLDYMLLFLGFGIIFVSVVFIMTNSIRASLRKYRQRHRQSPRHSLTIIRTVSGTKEPGRPSAAGASLVDSWMARRFSLACLIICAYIAYLAYYSSRSYKTALEQANEPGPDFSTGAAVKEYIKFIPLVTLSFMGFLLFGTTTLAIGHYKAGMNNLLGHLPWRKDEAVLTDYSRERGSLTVRAISIHVEKEKERQPSAITDWTASV